MIREIRIKGLILATIMHTFFAGCGYADLQHKNAAGAENESVLNAEALSGEVKDISQTNSEGYIEFGRYEQDGNTENGAEPIEWEIISEEGDRMLLVSRYILDCKPYNKTDEAVTWETCSLRKWMNDSFLKTAFSSGEQGAIETVTLSNLDNAKYGTDGGNDTEDKIFCLSVDELLRDYEFNYWEESGKYGYCQALMTEPTVYAKEQGEPTYRMTDDSYTNFFKSYGYAKEVVEKDCGMWWVRSTGGSSISLTSGSACMVTEMGQASWNGGSVTTRIGVRPALYLNKSRWSVLDTEDVPSTSNVSDTDDEDGSDINGWKGFYRYDENTTITVKEVYSDRIVIVETGLTASGEDCYETEKTLYFTHASGVEAFEPFQNGAGEVYYRLKPDRITVVYPEGWWEDRDYIRELEQLVEPETLKAGASETIYYPGGSVKVQLNEKMFMQDNNKYHQDISTLAVALSMAAYDDGYSNIGKGDYLYEAYQKLGFLSKDITLYSYPNNANGLNDNSEGRFKDNDMAFSIASRKLDDYTLLVINFRGTTSNMDVLKDASLFAKKRNFYGKENAWPGFHDFWQDFNVAIYSYLDKHKEVQKASENGKIILLITGHSLGAAAANLTGKAANMDNCGVDPDKRKIFVYTYACPNVSTTVSKDKNIFNIINKCDIVPDVPTDLRKYGNNMYFNSWDPYGVEGHGFGRYVDAVVNNMVQAPGDKTKKNKTNYYALFCPVDMEVRKGDKLIGRVVNNTIVDAVDEGYFYVEVDRKMFIAPDDDTYEIKLTAYEDGEMDIITCSSDGRVADQKNYLSVKLTKGDEFTTKFGKPSVVAKSELNVKHPDGSSETIKESEFQETKIPSDDTGKKTSVIWIIIAIAAAITILAVILLLIVRRKKRKDNSYTAKRIYYNSPSEQMNPPEQQLEPEQQVNPDEQQHFESRFCAKCGSPLDSEQLYCGVCGTKRI